jgi:hypothetical protein
MRRERKRVTADMAFISSIVGVSRDGQVTKFTFVPTVEEMSVTLEDAGAVDKGRLKWLDVVAAQMALYKKMASNTKHYVSVDYSTDVIGRHLTQGQLDEHVN